MSGKHEWEIIVGNVGSVLTTRNARDGLSTYQDYVCLSKCDAGRASGEAVVLLKDGEPVREYHGLGYAAE